MELQQEGSSCHCLSPFVSLRRLVASSRCVAASLRCVALRRCVVALRCDGEREDPPGGEG